MPRYCRARRNFCRESFAVTLLKPTLQATKPAKIKIGNNVEDTSPVFPHAGWRLERGRGSRERLGLRTQSRNEHPSSQSTMGDEGDYAIARDGQKEGRFTLCSLLDSSRCPLFGPAPEAKSSGTIRIGEAVDTRATARKNSFRRIAEALHCQRSFEPCSNW